MKMIISKCVTQIRFVCAVGQLMKIGQMNAYRVILPKLPRGLTISLLFLAVFAPPFYHFLFFYALAVKLYYIEYSRVP